jgi:hypothetical protein
VRIEVLYFDGCPGHERLMPRLGELLAATGVEDPVELVQVESLEDSERQRFLGSPTLRIDGVDVDPAARERIDGVDVDPAARERTDYGLKCRLYRTESGQQPLPSDEWILAAIEEARATPRSGR